MKKIPLTQGKFALVDDADFEWLNQWKWCAVFDSNKKWYAVRGAGTGIKVNNREKRRIIRMHRFIMGEPINMQVDHKELDDTLNNQRNNLRLATKSENMRNRGKQNNNKSGYKGVSWSRQNKKWYAWIGLNGKTRPIGHFDDIIEAAKAYNAVATELHGEFARLNNL